VTVCFVYGVFLVYTAYLYYCKHGWVNGMGLKPNSLDLSSLSILTLLVGSFDQGKVYIMYEILCEFPGHNILSILHTLKPKKPKT